MSAQPKLCTRFEQSLIQSGSQRFSLPKKTHRPLQGGIWDVPSTTPMVDESELAAFYISVWNSVWAPKGISPEITRKLAAAFSRTLERDRCKKLTSLGQQIPEKSKRSPEALAALRLAELAKWSSIINSAKFK